MSLREKLQLRWRVFYVAMTIGAAFVVMMLMMVFRVERQGATSGFDLFLVLLFAPAALPTLYLRYNLGTSELIAGCILQVFLYAFLAAARFRFRWTVIALIFVLHFVAAYQLMGYAEAAKR